MTNTEDYEVALQSDSTKEVLHWYDFVCPFCYVGQSRTRILTDAGITVAELAFQAHPEIPEGGKLMGPRSGPMYEVLNREAEEAGLPLRWPARLPNTRRALACAEWVRVNAPISFHAFQRELFLAHFAREQDLGSQQVIDDYAQNLHIDLQAMHAALEDGSAFEGVARSEELGRSFGVHGTPAWLIAGRLISGLRARSDFEMLAQHVSQVE